MFEGILQAVAKDFMGAKKIWFLNIDPLRGYVALLDVIVILIQCWNRILKAFANSLDPDEKPQNVASHQDPNSFRGFTTTTAITLTYGNTSTHINRPCTKRA
ncbi:hypothetical protein DPMN_062031 [Dreissena polymorpha]|uniref:Uncharacterized protein n=1 Tax=Dreissena polymorpha TaxID=45954 RepID=A0A9D4C8S7_DREPO|nr:hypothetical protein DPMN_062031 [Dreissena polymorpha]